MVDKIHSHIRQDLILHQEDLVSLTNHYTHKYRSGSRHLDINVGIFNGEGNKYIVQIYVADKNNRIREQLVLERGKITDTNIIIKRYEK